MTNHLIGANDRQTALASLFSSLSSLASNQQQQQQQHRQQVQAQAGSPSHISKSNQTINQIPSSLPQSSANTMSLRDSIQSVVAAAMMQQQLVTTALNRHQQQQSSTPPIPPLPASTLSSLLTEQMRASSFPFADQRLAPEVQLSVGSNFSQAPQQQQPQQQQRINYCTICNKELCNKYFMKTHMLKMHGINLEMEQPDDDDNSGKSREVEGEEGGEDSTLVDDGEDSNQAKDCSTTNAGVWSAQSVKKGQQGKNQIKSGTANSFSPSSKKVSNGKATSVMNGFAGNSMGGVVCDICNKELCSKYFLKVHKQNTHGIMTDYQDANQFMYPFAAPNPFITGTQIAPSVGLTHPSTAFPANPLAFLSPSSGSNNSTMKDRRAGGPKKQRLTSSQSRGEPQDIEYGDDLSTNSGSQNKQLDTVYRLLIAQHQQLMAGQQSTQAPLVPLDQAAGGPMTALMCFGAGPFGPAGMSPAMIVDNILRNQHLFNRNGVSTSGVQSNQQTAIKQGKDKNNNNNDTKAKGGKASKETGNSSRYFNHYTEACPMCDRRFKSIKWLKTHMMNDHKQEIGAYMQMMMQYLYPNKQVPGIAPFEHQQQLQQHPLFNNSPPLPRTQSFQSPQASSSFLSKCLSSPINSIQLQSTNLMPGFSAHQLETKQQITESAGVSSISDLSLKHGENSHLAAEDLIIDARCRLESLLSNRSSPLSNDPCNLSKHNGEQMYYRTSSSFKRPHTELDEDVPDRLFKENSCRNALDVSIKIEDDDSSSCSVSSSRSNEDCEIQIKEETKVMGGNQNVQIKGTATSTS